MNEGRRVTGIARFEVQDTLLIISVNVEGLEPHVMHQQHLHSFDNARHAQCPSGMEADTNGDSIVDLVETRAMAGIAMVPLHDNPASMEVHTETYPVADSEGKIQYREVVSLNQLSSAFERKFGQDTLDLSKHVLFIKGVNTDTPLPNGVMLPPNFPAHVTIPVACGAVKKVSGAIAP